MAIQPVSEAREDQLVWFAQKGDPRAWRALFERDREMIYRVAYRIVLNREDALDIVQETFCKAFINLHRYEGNEDWRPWLRTIAIRTALSRTRSVSRIFRRLGRRIGERESEQLSASGVPTALEQIEADRLSQSLHAALGRLSPRQRAVATLYFEEGLNGPQIAATLGLRPGTVKIHLARARRRLQKELRAFQPEPEGV